MSIELEKQGIWTQRNGEIIHVTDMSNEHLINVAKMLICIAKCMVIEYADSRFDYLDYLRDIEIALYVDYELKTRNLIVDEWS